MLREHGRSSNSRRSGDAVAKLHRVGVVAVFAADAEFFAGAGRIALLAGDLYQLANTGLINQGEGVLLHDLVFKIYAE